MTKITIEVSDSHVGVTTTALGAVASAPVPTGNAPSETGGVPADLLAQAAAVGARNAGPAPSLTGVTIGSAPVAASIGGSDVAPQPASGGAAPEYLTEQVHSRAESG